MKRLQTVVETAKQYLSLEARIEGLQSRYQVAIELENTTEMDNIEKSLNYIENRLKTLVSHTSKAVNKSQEFIVDCICRYEQNNRTL